MVVQDKAEALKVIRLFDGLTDQELDEVAKICGETSFSEGQLCQVEGQAASGIHVILKGKVGSVNRIPNTIPTGSELILEEFREGDMFGWSSLIKGTASWPSIRALGPVSTLYIKCEDLLDLCENNSRIGYITMRNLASFIASRLRRYRMSMLNTIVAVKGEW
jgi:CRP-like cAMP-binding protein